MDSSGLPSLGAHPTELQALPIVRKGRGRVTLREWIAFSFVVIVIGFAVVVGAGLLLMAGGS